MHIDPYILGFSAVTVLVTIWMGFWAARKSKTAHDFFVAGRSVSVGWNASAISGEYLSAASFMGIAGMVMSSGYDALWYPVCYACGYLFLLLFIAGPLRRFGAYTIPDFAEGRFDSPLFRKIAVIFVLFIGFFYTMPQMKGAGTTLAYIFPGLPYWAGVVLVGAVITLNVALGGMKGITLVQAFQYWAKMFAISVPVFVLMAVYGHYGRQVETNIPNSQSSVQRQSLPAKAPADATWLMPFGPLTTKAAKTAAATLEIAPGNIPLRPGLAPEEKMTVRLNETNLNDALLAYAELTGRKLLPQTNSLAERTDEFLDGTLSRWGLVKSSAPAATGITYHRDGSSSAQEVKERLETLFASQGMILAPEGDLFLHAFVVNGDAGAAQKALQQRWLARNERPLGLLYTYSLIIALVCGTAGLPHILVRFYTNPDGVAAKRTTMWVMILIGIFYVFPPVFGVMGRNLLPELYAAAGAKGTDKIVLELPRLLNQSYAPLGSILSGITCAGAFAAFMSTFSGLLVSMTGALAHDVYGRMLRPQSTPEQRMKMFRWCAVLLGAGAILGGMQVEPLQINFMVGQAFAIAAASYFPLLFMSTWWRGMTMKGAAAGMLGGGCLALTAISLTSFSDLNWIDLSAFWAANPLLRIICEQPAIWAVPLAIALMIFVSKLTRADIPADVRMKMLVLHAPEKLGLKQEYIQEHQGGAAQPTAH
ncbi:MAG TPA: cation acetate symporter [Clostridia bacterium]|nr:cation acetate symporter [Clostridia bacterium]